jgi:hypothetical protein
MASTRTVQVTEIQADRTQQVIAGQTYRTIEGVARRGGYSRSTGKRRVKNGLLPPADIIDENGTRWWADASVDRHDRKRLKALRLRAHPAQPAAT